MSGSTEVPEWKKDSDHRGADFRIIRPGEGENAFGINEYTLLESLGESKPLPQPLRWSVDMRNLTVAVEMERHDGEILDLLEYRFYLQGLHEGTRPIVYFWCLNSVCDTSRFAPCHHEWWRDRSREKDGVKFVGLKCAKCMVDDFVKPDIAGMIAIHGEVPREWSTAPGNYVGGSDGQMRELPVWPPQG